MLLKNVRINTAISDGFSELISTVKSDIDRRRRLEDNAKTEKNISQKQQQLAALRANTSGGNQVEIARLQKEINEAQQSYGRTLEDQMLESIQEQADIGAKQRERQITILQAQLDYQQQTGILAQHIEDILKNPDKYAKELTELYQYGNGYGSKSTLGKEGINANSESNILAAGAAVEALTDLRGKIKTIFGFATGGLASFTGPAWLDGTPSKPELVLNAADTRNFLALKDVLSRAMGVVESGGGSSHGDATYEININVDHLNSDYDVDKVAERVKKIIVKDSNYRNVTQVRNLR